ncbi:tyrosine-type recombinase/integrase [Kitasatospora sp. NPDC085895]|uniref:tyrosine-type recombinase/integrase n=1 Tax=Kitasatospora sp. NPDC085895 TaxID=3155057 RepID=UPI003450F11F
MEERLLDQFLLAGLGAGNTDGTLAADRAAITEFRTFTGIPLWEIRSADADRFLAHQRRDKALMPITVYGKAARIARFYDFLTTRYRTDILAVTGWSVQQPIDEFNRPHKGPDRLVRIPPSGREITDLFGAWRTRLPKARKFLPAARDYMTASLWRRGGLRINETVMLNVGDWYPHWGPHGKLHVRHGKGSAGTGPKERLVPGIDEIDALMTWWLTDVRPQWGDDLTHPGAPMFPSERPDRTGRCARVGPDAMRAGLARAVDTLLPAWSRRLTPHGLRHFCASSLYERGMGLRAIQDLLGHRWLATTSGYIHVHQDHIEQSWAGERAHRRPARLRGVTRVRWNLKECAATRGVTTCAGMRRLLAGAGRRFSTGKISALWSGTPISIRLDDLETICAVLGCEPGHLLLPDHPTPLPAPAAAPYGPQPVAAAVAAASCGRGAADEQRVAATAPYGPQPAAAVAAAAPCTPEPAAAVPREPAAATPCRPGPHTAAAAAAADANGGAGVGRVRPGAGRVFGGVTRRQPPTDRPLKDRTPAPELEPAAAAARGGPLPDTGHSPRAAASGPSAAGPGPAGAAPGPAAVGRAEKAPAGQARTGQARADEVPAGEGSGPVRGGPPARGVRRSEPPA